MPKTGLAPPGEDPRIAAFARANRRRNAIVLLALGIIVIVGCGIALAVMVQQPAEVLEGKPGRHRGSGYQLIVLLGGGVLVGIGILVAGYRIGRGQRAIDYDP